MESYEKQRKLSKSYLKYEYMLDMAGVTYPIGMDDIERVEKQNKNYKFNVWVPAGNDFYLQYQTSSIDSKEGSSRPRVLHLVLAPYLSRDSGEIQYHWYPIVNYNAFNCRRSITPKGR